LSDRLTGPRRVPAIRWRSLTRYFPPAGGDAGRGGRW